MRLKVRLSRTLIELDLSFCSKRDCILHRELDQAILGAATKALEQLQSRAVRKLPHHTVMVSGSLQELEQSHFVSTHELLEQTTLGHDLGSQILEP
jgi:hypothetical protein